MATKFVPKIGPFKNDHTITLDAGDPEKRQWPWSFGTRKAGLILRYVNYIVKLVIDHSGNEEDVKIAHALKLVLDAAKTSNGKVSKPKKEKSEVTV